MKKEAILFVLEPATDQHLSFFKEIAKKRIIMHEIYQPFTDVLHTISFDSVKKFLELYSKFFHRFVCATNVSLRGGAWKKLKNARTVITTSNYFPSWPTTSAEDISKMNNKIKLYHAYIQKLVDEKFSLVNRTHKKVTSNTVVNNLKQESSNMSSKNHAEVFDDTLQNFDAVLQNLYYNAINRELDLRPIWKRHCLKRATNEIENAFKRRTAPVHFNTSLMRCAYLLKYSACFTSAVARYFQKVSCSTNDILKAAFVKGVCVICCLGGGPASDIVGILRPLQDLYKPYWRMTKKQLKIQVVIVDLDEGWQKTVGHVFQSVLNTPELFCAEEAELLCLFLKADLSEELNFYVVNAIQSADILTMVHFLSVMQTIKEDNYQSTIQNIVQHMKKDSILLFLDQTFDSLHKVLYEIERERDLMQINQPSKLELHTLSLESMKKFSDLYSKYLNRFACNSNILFHFVLWKKTTLTGNKNLFSTQMLNELEIRILPTKSEKEKLKNQMNIYEDLVKKIIDERYKETNSQHFLNTNKYISINPKIHLDVRGKKITEKSDMTVAERLLNSAKSWKKV